MRVRPLVAMAIFQKPRVNRVLYPSFCSSTVTDTSPSPTTSEGSTAFPNSTSTPSSKVPFMMNQSYTVAEKFSSDDSARFTQRLDLFQSIGITPDGFSRIVSAYPQVLRSASDIDLADSFRILEDLLGKELLGECMVSWPSVLGLRFQTACTDKETLPENAVFLLNCGFKRHTKLLARALSCTMHKQKRELEACAHALKSLGLSNHHACRLIKLQPTILTQCPSEITAKLDYILHTFNFSLEQLLKYSSFMVYSLDMRIKPRYLMYQWLKSKRLMRRNFKLDYIITMPEKQFLCKYVECHQEGLSKYQEFMRNAK